MRKAKLLEQIDIHCCRLITQEPGWRLLSQFPSGRCGRISAGVDACCSPWQTLTGGLFLLA